MNALIKYNQASQQADFWSCMSEIYRIPSLTLNEFIDKNELLILDLIADASKGSNNAYDLYNYDALRQIVVDFMKDMFEYYILEDDFYLMCKH